MDVIFVVPLVVSLLVLRYYLADHDTPIDKDRKRFTDGIALYEAGDYAKARAYFDQKIKENRKSALAYAYRGKCNLQAENLYSALYDFTEALSFESNLPDIHFERGKVHFQLDEYQEAYLAFDKAVWFSRGSHAEAMQWRTKVYRLLHPEKVTEK